MSGKRIASKTPPSPEPRSLPEGCLYTAREFKALKRKQALAVEQALDDLILGSAYMPGSSVSIVMLREDIRRARFEWRKWWRNA